MSEQVKQQTQANPEDGHLEVYMPLVEHEPKIVETSEGPEFVLEDEGNIPVDNSISNRWDKQIQLEVIQPGTVKKNPHLAKLVGQYRIVNSTYGEDHPMKYRESLKLLPMAELRRSRTLMPEFSEKEDNKPICKSLDGVVPDPRIEMPVSEACGAYIQTNGKSRFVPSCPKAKWDSGDPPECKDSKTLAFFDLELGLPVTLQLKSTGLSSWNAFQALAEQKKGAIRNRNRFLQDGEEPQSILDFVITLTVEHKGTYVKPKFEYAYAPELNPRQYWPLAAYYYDLVKPIPGQYDEYDENTAGDAKLVEAEVDMGSDDPDEDVAV